MVLRMKPGNILNFSTIYSFFIVFNIFHFLSGRMALLVTLFLVLVNIFNTVTTNTPKAEGKILMLYHITNTTDLRQNFDYHYNAVLYHFVF